MEMEMEMEMGMGKRLVLLTLMLSTVVVSAQEAAAPGPALYTATGIPQHMRVVHQQDGVERPSPGDMWDFHANKQPGSNTDQTKESRNLMDSFVFSTPTYTSLRGMEATNLNQDRLGRDLGYNKDQTMPKAGAGPAGADQPNNYYNKDKTCNNKNSDGTAPTTTTNKEL